MAWSAAAGAVLDGAPHHLLPLRQALRELRAGNAARGREVMREAAGGGDARAMSNLALLLLEDGGIDEALDWARRGAAVMDCTRRRSERSGVLHCTPSAPRKLSSHSRVRSSSTRGPARIATTGARCARAAAHRYGASISSRARTIQSSALNRALLAELEMPRVREPQS
jgi:hypothetical protein